MVLEIRPTIYWLNYAQHSCPYTQKVNKIDFLRDNKLIFYCYSFQKKSISL
jgi:hypothetical protein